MFVLNAEYGMLALQEDESSAAEELGLLDLNPDSERLLLFQLPSLLPVPAASLSPARPNAPVKPLTHTEASSLHQLPAGKVSPQLFVYNQHVNIRLKLAISPYGLHLSLPCLTRSHSTCQLIWFVGLEDVHRVGKQHCQQLDSATRAEEHRQILGCMALAITAAIKMTKLS